jgi:hypothetical protein
MRVLVAILSCAHHAMGGHNQALRDSWLRDATSLEYRFFIGDGTPISEDTSKMDASWEVESPAYTQREFSDPSLQGYVTREDEVLLPTSDKYEHTSYKLIEALRWAMGEGFDFVFVCLTDTYVVPERLLNSGFEKTDYCGTANGERTAIGGGPGMWLSKKSIQKLVNAKVTHWAYDKWVGEILFSEGINLTHDTRYTNLDLGDEPPSKENDFITSHIANCDRTVYDYHVMLDLYQGKTQCSNQKF